MTANAQEPDPSPKTIRQNLAFGVWYSKNAGRIPFNSPVSANSEQPKLIDDPTLQKAASSIPDSYHECQPSQLIDLARLRDHASAYIMAHFPRATYDRPDSNTHIPSNKAIAHISHTWPRRNPANQSAPPINVRRNLPSDHPHNRPKQIAVSHDQNASHWTARTTQAKAYFDYYQSSGTVPPIPLVRDPDDDHQLILRAAWQDFHDFRHDPSHVHLPDLSRPAIPPRWLPGHSPDDILNARTHKKIAQTLKRSSERPPDELLDAQVRRHIVDSNSDPMQTDQTRTQSATLISDAKKTITAVRINTADYPPNHRQLNELISTTVSRLHHVSKVYPIDTATTIVAAASSLASAYHNLIADRKTRSEHGNSPTSTEAETRNFAAFTDATTAIYAFSAHPFQHADQSVIEFWPKIANTNAEALHLAAEYQFPDHQAPYEIETLNRISRLTLAELTDMAVKRYDDPMPNSINSSLLIPDSWIVQFQSDSSGNELTLVDASHISQILDTHDFEEASRIFDQYEQERRDRVSQLPALLADPPPIATFAAFTLWAKQSQQAIAEDIFLAGTDHPVEPNLRELFRLALFQTNLNSLEQHLTNRMRYDIILNLRIAYRHTTAHRWCHALESIEKVHHVVDPTRYRGYSNAAVARGSHYHHAAQLIRDITAAITPLADQQRSDANRDHTAWINLPPEKARQQSFSL